MLMLSWRKRNVDFRGMVPADAEAKFLEIASRLDTYGFDPYIVRVNWTGYMIVLISGC